MQYRQVVDSTPQSEDVTLSLDAASVLATFTEPRTSAISPELLHELWTLADAKSCSLSVIEWGEALSTLGARLNYGRPPGATADPSHVAAFYRALRLPELALATACVLGREAAWERFIALYRTPLLQAAIAMTGSATLGHDLAESLYAELYGLSEREGQRRSPLASYSGRGSLLGWLRTTLAQRHVDHHRRTYREKPLDDVDPPSSPDPTIASPAGNTVLTEALAVTLRGRTPEERFLLAAYYLDRQTLQQIGQILRVHEATISRRLKSLGADVRKQLLKNLQRAGLDKRAAQEALGTDPRDLEINLRALLQTSQSPPFSVRAGPKAAASPPESAVTTSLSDPQ